MQNPRHAATEQHAGPKLTQQIGLWSALAANILNMVGVGPFVTIPLILAAMGGPQAMLGWAAGALIALSDGLVWAELGAALPESGGSYNYLREAYGPQRWGQFMSFLFLAQTIISAPLTAASGAVGFAEYSTYLLPTMSAWHERLLAMGICLLATLLLYRNIQAIGKISIAFTAVLLGTMAWIIVAGAAHFHPQFAFDFPRGAFRLSISFFLGLGSAALLAMYDYSGYFNVCLIGAEIKNPGRNIPRCILVSIVLLGFCYTAMSFALIGVVPWRDAIHSKAIVSSFAERISGLRAAQAITGLLLISAFGSVYSVLLGYSRVPFAAAAEGHFFRVFARVHPTKGFPSFSVLAMGFASAVACLLSLADLIQALLVLQIMTQFIAQCVAVVLLRRYRPDIRHPFCMWLYPLPVAIALFGWIFILVSSGIGYFVAGLGGIAVASCAFLLWARRTSRE